MVDYVRYWSGRTELPVARFVARLGIGRSKFYGWQSRYGRVNEHNAWVPRDHWLETHEKAAIVAYHHDHPLEGYRRLTYMMMDENVVAASPSTVYRVLKERDLLARFSGRPSRKGTGFEQPSGRICIGMWTYPTSTSAGRSTISAACSMDTAATLFIGKYVSR